MFTSMHSRLVLGLALAIGLAVALLFAAGSSGPAHAAVGGPVILGGDDLTDHGEIDDSTVPPTLIEGWLYIKKALENIEPNVKRPGNDGTVAVLGSADSTEISGDAGAGYHYAVPQVAGLAGVSFFEGPDAINGFFTDLSAGNVNPAIIVTAGTGASNDLDSDEGTALTNNATGIANFVNSGGGLMSHGSGETAYGWLTALFPAALNIESGSSDDLYLTPDGTAAFPGLTTSDVNAGPWHSHFEGDIGDLKVLVRSSDVLDSQDFDAAVIIGGASVKLPGSIDLSPSEATNFVGSTHTVTATVLDGTPPVPAVGVTVTFAVTDGPNAGTTGTCSANADCTTDANGQVSFTYLGDGGIGTDTISASFVTARQITESTLAQKTWEEPEATPTATATPTPVPTLADVVELPRTGGTPSEGAGLPWLVLATGALALVSGGAWLAYQRRRTR